jgi:hypothetical protein
MCDIVIEMKLVVPQFKTQAKLRNVSQTEFASSKGRREELLLLR